MHGVVRLDAAEWAIPEVTRQPMRMPQELIAAKFERSVFVLAFETEEIVGYRSGLQRDVLRALYINLKRWSAEYELTQGGLPIRRRIEYFPTMAHLIEKLPVTVASFDLKFQGLGLKDDGGAVADTRSRVALAGTKDPWDLANYYEKPRTRKPQRPTHLKLEDEEFR